MSKGTKGAVYRPPKTSRFVDRTGRRYGNLVVTELYGWKKSFAVWRCKCDCGKTCLRWGTALVRKTGLHCGCKRKNPIPAETWRLWLQHKHILAPEWAADVRLFHDQCISQRPAGKKKLLCLCRIDESQPMGPGNFVFRRRGLLIDNGAGEVHTASEWSEILGITRERMRQRINKYGPEKAVSYGKLANGEMATVHGELIGLPRSGPRKPGPAKYPGCNGRVSQDTRRVMREQALAMILAGKRPAEVAQAFGRKVTWCYQLMHKAGLHRQWVGANAL